MTGDPIAYSRFDAGRDCNYWELDRTLQFAAEQAYPGTEWRWAEDRLREWGQIVGEEIAENSATVDRHGPELHTYDRNGAVQNEVEYHPLQSENEQLTYGFGVVADAFDVPAGRDEPTGLLHHLLQNGLLSFADPGFACPVAMTGGVALVLDKFADHSPDPELLGEYFERLTTRNPDTYVEGAMFLTEKQGGSDVGANETVAEPTDEEGVYHLRGEKWFCSNIDAEGTLVLARRPGAPDGTAGLSLFLVPHTKRDGDLNDQVYRRLKDKLGTISVPTGEVELHGAEGYLVGEPERGFKYMTEMLNLERLHNAFASIGIMGRCLLESKVHAANREAFGQTIDEFPLMRRDLVEMAVDYEAAVAFTFEAARALDRREVADEGTDERQEAHRLVRSLVPVAKYRTGRMAVDTASYACEVLGGNGYVEGFATERLLRDAQVLPIWEGTSNILSLDLLRALDKEDAHEALLPFVSEKLDVATRPELGDLKGRIEEAHVALQESLVALATADRDYAQHEAKQLADLVFDVVTAATLLEHAQVALEEDEDARKALVATWFVKSRFEKSLDLGITDEDALPHEQFDAIVRYASADPGVLETTANPAD